MFSRKTRPRALHLRSPWLRACVTGVVLTVSTPGARLETTGAKAEENGKAVGEDLAVAELSALVAVLKHDQLSKRGKIFIPELKEKHLKGLELMTDDSLTTTRGICAAHRMPFVRQRVDAAEPAPVFPEVHAYCLKAIEVSAKRDRLSDLYMNLALQEQGRSSLQFASDAELLKNNEAGRTRLAVLKAANSGEAAYLSITDKQRQLHCPLALDAGFAFGYRSPEKDQPYELTAPEVQTIARACYDPTVKEIALKDALVPAQKAGLFAGAWLGQRQRLEGGTRQ